jgi:hypothetical protein
MPKGLYTGLYTFAQSYSYLRFSLINEPARNRLSPCGNWWSGLPHRFVIGELALDSLRYCANNKSGLQSSQQVDHKLRIFLALAFPT